MSSFIMMYTIITYINMETNKKSALGIIIYVVPFVFNFKRFIRTNVQIFSATLLNHDLNFQSQ